MHDAAFGHRGRRQRIDYRSRRGHTCGHEVVARAADVAELKRVTCYGDDPALRNSGECADDGIRAVIVENRERVADCRREAVNQAEVECAAQRYPADHVELIELNARQATKFDLEGTG